MLSKAPLAYCMITLFVMNSTPPTHAFGTDILEQLTDLLFGSDESSEESMETVINTKPNATLTVICKTGCDLNVMCVNCTNVNAVMMPPTNGGGSDKTTTQAPVMSTVAMTTAAPATTQATTMNSTGTMNGEMTTVGERIL